jgi:hypothetical protein
MDVSTQSTMNDRRLRDRALVGRPAQLAELALIGVLAAIVVAIHASVDQLDRALLVPLVALGLGAAGALAGGPTCVGYIRNPGYLACYALVIGLMMGLDVGVRLVLGGELWLVPCNWAVLIGSASAIDLLVTRLPWLSARRLVDEASIGRLHPIAWLIVIALQIGQAWISVLGAPLGVVLIQLLVRRLAILPVVHVIARVHYGPGHAGLLRDNATLEYFAVRTVARPEGSIEEPDPIEQTVVGTLLLKLPIFAGESMGAGRKSLTRVADKLVFVEQMLAFSSPTMVVVHPAALGHTAFIHGLLGLAGDPAERNGELADRLACKAKLHDALAGRWTTLRGDYDRGRAADD